MADAMVQANDRRPVVPWAGGVILPAGLGLIVVAARKRLTTSM